MSLIINSSSISNVDALQSNQKKLQEIDNILMRWRVGNYGKNIYKDNNNENKKSREDESEYDTVNNVENDDKTSLSILPPSSVGTSVNMNRSLLSTSSVALNTTNISSTVVNSVPEIGLLSYLKLRSDILNSSIALQQQRRQGQDDVKVNKNNKGFKDFEKDTEKTKNGTKDQGEEYDEFFLKQELLELCQRLQLAIIEQQQQQIQIQQMSKELTTKTAKINKLEEEKKSLEQQNEALFDKCESLMKMTMSSSSGTAISKNNDTKDTVINRKLSTSEIAPHKSSSIPTPTPYFSSPVLTATTAASSAITAARTETSCASAASTAAPSSTNVFVPANNYSNSNYPNKNTSSVSSSRSSRGNSGSNTAYTGRNDSNASNRSNNMLVNIKEDDGTRKQITPDTILSTKSAKVLRK